jgi:glycine/D-amino acid oxidase-like deaminating enzyme
VSVDRVNMDQYGKNPSLWVATVPPTTYPTLSGDLTVDIVIIGAGITGITAATLLKEAGRNVAVIEAQHVGGGVTGRTTAHLTEFLDSSYEKLLSDFGEDSARLAATSAWKALDQIARWVNERKIECDFRRVPGYLYSDNDEDREQLEREVEAASKAGVKCELTNDIPLPFPTKLALKADNQAQFHPMKYLQVLAENIPGNGNYLFENTHVEKVEDGTPCRVTTDHGTKGHHGDPYAGRFGRVPAHSCCPLSLLCHRGSPTSSDTA